MSNQEKISQKFYEALMSKYASEMNEAEATLLVYFNNPVGIGEHPQHLEEMDKMVEKMTSAKDKLDMLETVYKYNLKKDGEFLVTEDMIRIINEQKEKDGN